MFVNGINLTRDKEKNLNYIYNTTLLKTIGMFNWIGLPDTIPPKRLETILQTRGYAILIVNDNELYAVEGNPIGQPDINGNYTQYNYTINNKVKTVNNPYVIYNDSLAMGLNDIILKYGALIVESEISLEMLNILNRAPSLISSSDHDTKTSADNFIKHLRDGEYSIIGDSQFFDGITSHKGTQGDVLQTIELNKYFNAKLNQSLGIDTIDNFKRERLVNAEVTKNNTGTDYIINDMLKNRQVAVDYLNNKYNFKISVTRGDKLD